MCLGAVLSISKRAFHRLIDTEGGGGGRAPGYVPILVNGQRRANEHRYQGLWTPWTPHLRIRPCSRSGLLRS